MDLKLFQKNGRKNELTRTGLVIYGFCRQMFEISEEMIESIFKKVPSATRLFEPVENEIQGTES